MEELTFAEKAARMRVVSGRVDSDDALVIFLYTLAREHLPTGEIDSIIDREIPPEACFTNGWLGQWAKDAAGRLTFKDRCVDDPKDGLPMKDEGGLGRWKFWKRGGR